MTRILLVFIILVSNQCRGQEKKSNLADTFKILDPVEVRAIRAGENAPFTKTNLSQKEIVTWNLGQDLPFLLNQTPSVVANSDAGNGIGYTGIRIRGSDATRINVTINGIPYNDAESQGTFFVDLPDFVSSVNSIQVQRGVGTSSNGSGAFGASINLSTNEVNSLPYAEVNSGYGSFNTWKNTIKAGSGLMGKHFTTDIRLSSIRSSGFIDRATSDLKSMHFSTAYLNNTTSFRFNMFLGKEKTYQAWYGVAEADLINNRTVNYAGTERQGTPYDNETDNYRQDHYQFFFDHKFGQRITFNTALFLTSGQGYYEQYKAGQSYSDYQQPNSVIGTDTFTTSDLVRQLWLDNEFFGNIFSLQYKDKISNFTLGGGWTRYNGNHFGKVVWAEKGLSEPGKRWYDLDAVKTDFTLYFKEQTQFAKNWNLFYDLQYRIVRYHVNGFRANPLLLVRNKYQFFNPKLGVSFSKNGFKGYLSFSRGSKEPNRDDFEAGVGQSPKPEHLNDLELGIEKKKLTHSWSVVLYHMDYKDQLVLTGRINEVGAYTRTNIPNSYRMGIELQGSKIFSNWFSASGNVAFSKNKLRDFTEYIDDYDAGGQKTNYFRSPDISFSPEIVAGTDFSFYPHRNFALSWISKYVSKQYLDNTENESRKLDPFLFNDVRLTYTLKKSWFKEMNLILQVNNIFDRKYEPNGYTFSYISGGSLVTQNYYFPMAGVNFLSGIHLKF